jgi:hypothetical protein
MVTCLSFANGKLSCLSDKAIGLTDAKRTQLEESAKVEVFAWYLNQARTQRPMYYIGDDKVVVSKEIFGALSTKFPKQKFVQFDSEKVKRTKLPQWPLLYVGSLCWKSSTSLLVKAGSATGSMGGDEIDFDLKKAGESWKVVKFETQSLSAIQGTFNLAELQRIQK